MAVRASTCECCCTARSCDSDFYIPKRRGSRRMAVSEKAMDHQEAIQKYAADGYLLNELTEAEREEFEEHFAECDDCSDYVRDGLRFATALPVVIHKDERV